jgi:hypothetical protein
MNNIIIHSLLANIFFYFYFVLLYNGRLSGEYYINRKGFA